MDVSQPVARLRSIVGQVKPHLILTSAQKSDIAAAVDDDAMVFVIGKDTIANIQHTKLLLPAVSYSCTLYIVFTSGSTGLPKGE